MKAFLTLVIISLVFTINSVAQVTDAVKRDDVSGEVWDPVLNDPKTTEEEKAGMRLAGKDNPSVKNPNELLDQKLGPDEIPDARWFGKNNDGKQQMDRDEAPPPVIDKSAYVNGHAGMEQPKGETSPSVTNYHSVKGLDSQPEGQKPEEIINYRQLKGKQEQPTGDNKE
jgi:hypothetical protein